MIQNSTMNSFSSASFSMTLYDVMLELVKPILAKPELMQKIDIDFFYDLQAEFRYSEVETVKTPGTPALIQPPASRAPPPRKTTAPSPSSTSTPSSASVYTSYPI